VDYEKLSGDRLGESSESIRGRVQAARNIQQLRFTNRQSDIICNADMRVGEIRQFCKLQDEGQSLMRAAMSQMNLSARAYHRILKLALTIADLAGSEEIQSLHLAEALQYRLKLMCNTMRLGKTILCSGYPALFYYSSDSLTVVQSGKSCNILNWILQFSYAPNFSNQQVTIL
jgi:hypothetical protein